MRNNYIKTNSIVFYYLKKSNKYDYVYKNISFNLLFIYLYRANYGYILL